MSAGTARKGHGVLRIGDRLIGVPFDNLAEVCVVPEVSKLMVADGPILGGFDLRGFLVPLVDVENLCGLPARDRAVQRAAVLQHDQRITAIALDEIVTLTEAEPTKTDYGHTAPQAGLPEHEAIHRRLFASGFVMDGGIVNCLDSQVLFAMRDVPSIANTRTSRRTSGAARARKYLVFSAGGARFGVDAEHISATVPRSRIDSSEIGANGGLCLGFIAHHGWKVPVVHTNLALGVGGVPDLGVAEIVVLRFPEGRLLGLAVEATESLSSIPADRIAGSAALVADKGLLPRVHVTDSDVQIFMIDVAVLTSEPDLKTISELAIRRQARPSAQPSPTNGAGAIRRESERYLVFEAGCRMAVPARQVARILHRPRTIITASDLPATVRGFFPVAGHSVPLVELSDQVADGADDGFVLLVSVNGGHVGFAADRICSMQTSQWRKERSQSADEDHDLVELRDLGRTSVLPVVDLASLARSLAPAVPGDGRGLAPVA